MEQEDKTATAMRPWGTWEELLLAGAVLRHGPADWKVVSGELRARTVSPLNVVFTPEICKAKYEDLQRVYDGSKIWFEELRKKRIFELKNALELSEDSIGSLETKIGILNAERKCDSQDSYDSSRTESGFLCLNNGNEFSSKETSKDVLSAGSFTQETGPHWSPDRHVRMSNSTEETEAKPEASGSQALDTLGIIVSGIFKGRRGKRKRRFSEVSVGENSTSCCLHNVVSSETRQTSTLNNDVISVFSNIAEQNCASVFRRRLDSQKRGRYKKMIMRHLDFETVRTRISNGEITTCKEVFRDLLLLANNALVYYSRTTREYKSALLLREIISRDLKEKLSDYISHVTISKLSSSSLVFGQEMADKDPLSTKQVGKLKGRRLKEGRKKSRNKRQT